MNAHGLSLCWVAAALLLAAGCAAAVGQTSPALRVILPGSGYEVVLDTDGATPGQGPSPALIEAISTWLSSSFDLPPASEPPKFRFVPPQTLLAMKHRPDHGSAAPGLSAKPEVIALYDVELRTIYLRQDWRGHDAAELSIVVHELAHHHQNMAGLKFACPEEREKTAFDAQQQWLGLFGSDLETAFGLDPFTLLARTTCLN